MAGGCDAIDVGSGHLLVMPDGKRRFWSDYGVLEKCLNPGENKETLREEAFRGR